MDAPIPVFRLGFDFEETTLTLEAREQIALAMDFHNTEVEQSRWSTGVDVYLVCGPPDDSAQSERTRRDVLRYSAISKSLVSHGLLEDHITRAAWERGDDGAPNTMCYLTWRRAR